MTNENYNGWSNKQTWNINLRYEEIFADMANEQEYDDVEHMADSFESLVDELEFEGVRENSLAHEALSAYLHAVDWEEIAGHYFEDEVSEDDYDKMAQIVDLLSK